MIDKTPFEQFSSANLSGKTSEEVEKMVVLGEKMKKALDIYEQAGYKNTDKVTENFVFSEESRNLFMDVHNEIVKMQKAKGIDPDKRSDNYEFEDGQEKTRKRPSSTYEYCVFFKFNQ